MKNRKSIIQGIFLISFLSGVNVSQLYAQKFYTKSGKIDFFSKTSFENIEAVNKSATAILDTKSGQIQVVALVKGFEFERALMQEHFNENYMESDKYPRSAFSGTIAQNEKINYAKDGTYNVAVKGTLSLHNVSREMEIGGKIIISQGMPQLVAEFYVSPEDFHITIPALVANKISKNIRVIVSCTLNNTVK